jgi:hypothetical protein
MKLLIELIKVVGGEKIDESVTNITLIFNITGEI